MIKVITYGTFDVLHYGHIRLLERAKALGDYLIVGVTSDDYDKIRGKINNRQTLMERVAAVSSLGIADEVIAEEYEGQKIDDIRKYNIDIFTVGSDWEGKFDYLNNYCKVIYLPRTEGVSSTDIRTENRRIKLGIVGESLALKKFYNESLYVNGIEVMGICSKNREFAEREFNLPFCTDSFSSLIEKVDAVYIASHPSKHYEQIRYALEQGKHVLSESPISLTVAQCDELFQIAKEKGVVLVDAVKTAYATAYTRMLLMLKSGKIGKVVSVDATCTSLKNIDFNNEQYFENTWNSICAWGTTAMLPVFQILGVGYKSKQIISAFADKKKTFDFFTNISFVYGNATATIKVGKGVKSEGELIVSGTKGYIYVPAPWWKTEYFEVRYENVEENKKFFYQLEGEGIRYEIAAFSTAIGRGCVLNEITQDITREICSVIEDFNNKRDLVEIKI